MHQYIFNYNNTIHDTTGLSPSALLFKFIPRTKLHIINCNNDKSFDSNLELSIENKKKKTTEYANERRRPQFNSNFYVGDYIKARNSPVRKIIKQIGKYTYRLDDGAAVNQRNLKLIDRQKQVDLVAGPKLIQNELVHNLLQQRPIRNIKHLNVMDLTNTVYNYIYLCTFVLLPTIVSMYCLFFRGQICNVLINLYICCFNITAYCANIILCYADLLLHFTYLRGSLQISYHE